MGRNLDHLLVLDLESTCWEGSPPDDQEPEIIEIGVCVLDARNGERIARESILVQPERSDVSPFCAQLTTLTPDTLARGATFARACAILRRKYSAPRRVWASYGDDDRRMFERQCQARGMPYPLSGSHINIKSLFALVHGLEHEIGLLPALEMFGVPVEGTHHRGVDDAWNAAGLLASLLMRWRMALLDERTPLMEDL
ncbi:MAG: exonuclease domain-containing protein [Chloroflexi bacterium]|nr:exonuclease domain-containing protein [Chloroflexota bacterium]